MRLTVVGCGDAFGSGGRLNTCYHVEDVLGCYLIDCGASTMIGFDREGLDPNKVDAIYISHLHGDHFAGLVWWLLHAQHVVKRTGPLTVVGPPGIEARFIAAAEALFAGSTTVKRRFEMSFVEITAGAPLATNGRTITAYEVIHPSGAPSHALRIEAAGKVLSFSGDTEWTEALIPCAKGADLMLLECYGFDSEVGYHMSWRTIEKQLPHLEARRVMLTHMNREMLAHVPKIDHPRVLVASDGLKLEI